MQYLATVMFSVAISVGVVYALRGGWRAPAKPDAQPVIDPASDAEGLDAIAKVKKA